jgi:hypothetical protein
MSNNIVFMGWNRAVPGRERASGELFQEVLQYLGGLQQAGTIDSFEPVLLSPHGGDLNGFILIRGEIGQLSAMMASEEWQTFVTRGGLLLEGSGVVQGVTGDLIMQWMDLWTRNIPS